ncbi:MAG TPA: polysaccharide biosynthesis C-terminal domain-containing protein, partial [Ignavibacteriales bacterium]|nr:polysaccharide biosynthesis C-terminal domain-containing protein [Ignavibacteriales bacterium]
SIISMTAVTFYTAPYEAITRLLIIPISMTMTLFPAFSTLNTLQDKERIGTIFFSSLKFVLLFLGPIIIMIGVFANEILQIWLGNDFASKSTLLLKILSIGVLFNSLAQFPFAFLQGIGRPDLPAKFHLIELIFYIGMVLYLVKHCGINGAAMAWTIRVSIDTLLLFVGVFKIYRTKLNFENLIGLVWPSATLIIFSVINYLLRSFGQQLGFFSQTIFIAALLIVLFWLFWLKFDNKVCKLLINMIK